MHFTGFDEPLYLDNLCALQFDLLDVLGRDDDVFLRLKLVTFNNILACQGFAAFLAFFIVANCTVIFLVQLIEPDCFLAIHCAVNPNGDSHQRKPNMTLPNRSHHKSILLRNVFHADGYPQTIAEKQESCK